MTSFPLFVATGLALFNGVDAAGNMGLWVTNGTAAGTTELAVSGASPGGLQPYEITVFGNKAYFGGEDASGQFNLWVTDGTAAGTKEITSPGPPEGTEPTDITVLHTGVVLFNGIINGEPLFNLYTLSPLFAGGNLAALSGATGPFTPTDIAVFGINRALLSGADQLGIAGLWVTDGRFVEELVSGASVGGLYPTDITVLGNKALFNGADAKGLGLWVTDGTIGGTREILQSVLGSVAGVTLDPSDITVLGDGDRALFNGADATGHFNLFVTNGTTAGTAELSVSGASLGGLNPTDITVFGNRALFSGVDANGNIGLWITNGTSAGTLEILAGTASEGGLQPDEITVVGNFAVFNGVDATGNMGLWVTNGTAAAELPALGASSGGLNPTDITAFGNKVLFNGVDAAGHMGLWVTNGISVELAVAGASPQGLNPTDITDPQSRRHYPSARHLAKFSGGASAFAPSAGHRVLRR